MGKIKAFLESDRGKDILTIAIVVLVGLGSFELGRLSKGASTSPLKIEYTSQDASVLGASQVVTNSNHLPSSSSAGETGKVYFASSRGQKYYHLGCSGGKDLKEENKIFFNSSAEAEAAGYELSSTCK